MSDLGAKNRRRSSSRRARTLAACNRSRSGGPVLLWVAGADRMLVDPQLGNPHAASAIAITPVPRFRRGEREANEVCPERVPHRNCESRSLIPGRHDALVRRWCVITQARSRGVDNLDGLFGINREVLPGQPSPRRSAIAARLAMRETEVRDARRTVRFGARGGRFASGDSGERVSRVGCCSSTTSRRGLIGCPSSVLTGGRVVPVPPREQTSWRGAAVRIVLGRLAAGIADGLAPL